MQRRTQIATLIAATAVMLLAGGCNKKAAPMPEGKLSAALALDQLGGGRFDPAVLAGKKVIVNFWSPR